jgi:uncharacterized hydrophobic protein (TIGR00271 family)
MPAGWGGGKFYEHIAFTLSAEQKDSVYHSILQAGGMDPEYLSMLGLSALIALFGLLQNSAAVIIGAMLISPLMNPILSAALALLLGDGNLGRRSAIVLVVSVAVAIGLTWLVTLLTPLREATPEILARTNPNLLDLFIAFLSGLAGTLALRSSSTSLTIIPGVAIAVAVIPPLAVVGYGLSTHQGRIAGGAFLLFVTNLVAIIISAAVVFRVMGFRPHEEAEKGRLNLLYRMAISAAVLLVLSIPLLQTLRKAVTQVGLRSDIVHELDAALKTPHSSVGDLTYSRDGGRLLIHATLRTTRYFETHQIDAAQESLRKRFGSDTRLEVDQILVAEGGISPEQAARLGNFISGGVVRPAAQEAPFDFKLSGEKMLAHVQKQVDEVLAGTPIRQSGETSVQVAPTRSVVVRLELEAPEPLDAQTIGLLASQLSSKLASPVQLHGEVRLQGQGYQLAVQLPESRRALLPQERQDLAKLARVVRLRPDLRLQITEQPASGESGKARPTSLLREIERIFVQSRLEPSRWSIQQSTENTLGSPRPAAAVGGARATLGTGTSGSPGTQVRYEFQTYQDF